MTGPVSSDLETVLTFDDTVKTEIVRGYIVVELFVAGAADARNVSARIEFRSPEGSVLRTLWQKVLEPFSNYSLVFGKPDHIEMSKALLGDLE